MGGKASREKGKRFERWVVNALKLFWPDARRNHDQAERGGHDIKGTPYTIECKNHKKVPLRAAWNQTLAAAEKRAEPPLLIWKDLRETPMVMMQFRTFVSLLLRAGGQDEQEG